MAPFFTSLQNVQIQIETISYDQRWNNTAALTTLRTGKGVRYLWRYGKVYSHLALVDTPNQLLKAGVSICEPVTIVWIGLS